MSPRNARLPDLPDVPTDEFRQVESDRFRELTTARINSSRFLASTSQALADARQQANGLRRADRLEPSQLAPTGDVAGQQDAAPSPAASAMPTSLEGPSVATRPTFGAPARGVTPPASAADSFRAWAGNQIDSARSKLATLGFAPDTAPTPTDALFKAAPGAVVAPDQASGPTIDAYERGRQVGRQGGVYIPPTSGLTGQNFGQEAANVLEAERNRTRPMLGPGGGLGIYNPNLVPETGLGNAAPEEATAAAGELAGGVPVVGGLLKFLAHPGDVFGGGGGNLAKRPPTVDEALTTARDAWTRVSTIADSLGIDLAGHGQYLQDALGGIAEAPGTLAHARQALDAYGQVLSDAANQIGEQAGQEIGPLQAQIAAYRETAQPELARWGRAFLDPNGAFKENIPLSTWQRVTGDQRTLAPNALVKRGGTVYVKPEYAADELYGGSEATGRLGKQFGTLGEFQQGMADAVTQDNRMRAAAQRIAMLTDAEKQATALYHASLPDESLLAAPATAGQPTTLPTQGNAGQIGAQPSYLPGRTPSTIPTQGSAGQTGTQAALIPGAAPAGGGVASPITTPAAAATPGLLGQLAGRLGLGKVTSAANQILAPALNTPPAVQAAIEDFANGRLAGQVHADYAGRAGLSTVAPGDALLTDQFITRIKAAGPDAIQKVAPATPAPAGWVRGGALHPNLTGYALAPEVAAAVRNVLPAGTRPTTAGSALSHVLGTAKETVFSLGLFHLKTELAQNVGANGARAPLVFARTLLHAAVPGAYNAFRLDPANAQLYSDAARWGVSGLVTRGGARPDIGGQLASPLARAGVRALTGGLSTGLTSYAQQKAGGASDQQALTTALTWGLGGAVAGATVAPALSAALWERSVPTLKVLTFEIQRQAGRDPAAAAAFVNQTYGGNNLAAIARAPAVTQALRVGMLAPDWWEGWTRQVGSALTPGDLGGMSRAYWLRTAVVQGAFGLEGLNLALNGHFTDQNDPGHGLDLETTGYLRLIGKQQMDPKTGQPVRTYANILGPLRDILTAPSDPARFLKGRVGMLPGAALTAWENKDPATGRPIVAPGTPWPIGAVQQAAYAAGRIAPAGLAQYGQTSGKGAAPELAIPAAIVGARLSSGAQRSAVDTSLPGSSQAILRSAGVTYAPGAVGRSIRGVPLVGSEQSRYQTLANQYRDVAVHDLATDPEWKTLTPAEADRAAKSAVARADARAANEVLQSIPDAEIARRTGGK